MKYSRQVPEDRVNGADRTSSAGENVSQHSVGFEDTFDDVFIRAPHLPGVRSDEHVREPESPSGDFDPEDAAARQLASKFAPQQSPQTKSGGPQNDGPYREWMRFPALRKSQRGEYRPKRNDYSRAVNTPRASKRSLYWSLCASVVVIAGTSAACSFVQPLSNLLPESADSFSGDGSGPETILPLAETPSTKEPLTDAPSAQSSLSQAVQDESPLIDAASDPREPAVPPSVANENKTDLSAGLRETATPLRSTIDDASSTSESTPQKDLVKQPQKTTPQQSAQADPVEVTPPPAKTKPATPDVEPPVKSPLSAAQIEILLTRGNELLQSGDVVSARLLFLRVAGAGDRRGAKGVAMTYDPEVYARLPVAGLTPDREMAAAWYRKAGGDVTLPINGRETANTGAVQDDASTARHAACARKYRSYNPATGFYNAHSGTLRPCRLP